ncbi:hypothetical protein BDN67DRAFT_819095 [Paxillus ammoniavirescens]|nr:hypothetical protein BDN67DRAFT_819095 [Paxillus ammoniavirescens]
MGYVGEIPANRFGRFRNLWVMREYAYGLSRVWVIRESTVFRTGMTTPSVARSSIYKHPVSRVPSACWFHCRLEMVKSPRLALLSI